jgi:hypothetical protein
VETFSNIYCNLIWNDWFTCQLPFSSVTFYCYILYSHNSCLEIALSVPWPDIEMNILFYRYTHKTNEIYVHALLFPSYLELYIHGDLSFLAFWFFLKKMEQVPASIKVHRNGPSNLLIVCFKWVTFAIEFLYHHGPGMWMMGDPFCNTQSFLLQVAQTHDTSRNFTNTLWQTRLGQFCSQEIGVLRNLLSGSLMSSFLCLRRNMYSNLNILEGLLVPRCEVCRRHPCWRCDA